jgi:hypothetical protein
MNLDVQKLDHELESISREHRMCSDMAIIRDKVIKWQKIMSEEHEVELAVDFLEEFSRAGIFANLWD